MALTCHDIGRLVHPYLDGEFSDDDRVALEQHTTECGPCRDLVQYEMAFKASMRTKLSPPKASSDLRRRVCASLDEVDNLHGASAPGRLLTWLLPSGAMAAAAAAIALFFLYPNASKQQNSSAETGAAIDPRNDAKRIFDGRPMPMPVGNTDQVRREMSRAVGIPVRIPQFDPAGGHAAGVRVVPLKANRFGAQINYQFPNGDISVLMFDSRGLKPTRGVRRIVGHSEVLCDEQDGVRKFFYEKDGVGHVITSDMSEDETLRIIRSDLESR